MEGLCVLSHSNVNLQIRQGLNPGGDFKVNGMTQYDVKARSTTAE